MTKIVSLFLGYCEVNSAFKEFHKNEMFRCWVFITLIIGEICAYHFVHTHTHTPFFFLRFNLVSITKIWDDLNLFDSIKENFKEGQMTKFLQQKIWGKNKQKVKHSNQWQCKDFTWTPIQIHNVWIVSHDGKTMNIENNEKTRFENSKESFFF